MEDLEKYPEYSTEEISSFIVQGHLFSKRSYDIQNWSLNEFLYIYEISTVCDVCKKEKPFQNLKTLHEHQLDYFSLKRAGFLNEINGKTETLIFQCVSCNTQRQTYLVNYLIDDEIITLIKAGEFPKYHRVLNKSLSKFLAKDKMYFQKAMACLDRDLGIAAFTYLRRIIENNIYRLLDIIKESLDQNDIQIYGEPINKIGCAFENLKVHSPMSDKIKVANFDLPSYLCPNGENPLGRMYAILSEGVHSLSDKECMELSEEVLVCLTYLVQSISNHKRERDEYLTSIRNLKIKKINR